MDNKKRCKWCNMKNSLYIKYHDEEWCKPNFDEKYLYEMLILESFQAGLSWECVLNKRQAFEMAYDNFNIEKVCQYDDEKIIELQQNKEIIRNKLKIKDEYYFGILTDPVFIIKNMICKYDLKYKVVTVDEESSYLVVNESNECMLIFIRMKNLYFENDKLLFQENNDEANEHNLEEYMKSIESDTLIIFISKFL